MGTKDNVISPPNKINRIGKSSNVSRETMGGWSISQNIGTINKPDRHKKKDNSFSTDFHPNLIRAWFDTVLNPMIEGLRAELFCLEKKNLTWRSFTSSFELLKPLYTMVYYKYNDNLEQCIVYIDGLLETINNHDNSLKSLNDSANSMYLALLNSPLLLNTFKNKLDKYLKSNPDTDNQLQMDLQSDNTLRFITEYIINNREKLDRAYILSPFWNENSKDFLNILTNRKLSSKTNSLKKAIEEFEVVVDRTLDIIMKKRDHFSILYGVPLVQSMELQY